MAVNVYMVFFFAANPKNFLNYWWAYFFVCYGIPFIPAMWLLLARGDDKGQVYGNATVSTPFPTFGALPISSYEELCVLTERCRRYGAGLIRTGATCASTPTTFPYGCAFSCQPAYTSPWGTMFSSRGINCAISRSETPPKTPQGLATLGRRHVDTRPEMVTRRSTEELTPESAETLLQRRCYGQYCHRSDPNHDSPPHHNPGQRPQGTASNDDQLVRRVFGGVFVRRLRL